MLLKQRGYLAQEKGRYNRVRKENGPQEMSYWSKRATKSQEPGASADGKR